MATIWSVGTTFTVRSSETTETWTVDSESDTNQGIISAKSPFGQFLLITALGQKSKFLQPDGEEVEYEVTHANPPGNPDGLVNRPTELVTIVSHDEYISQEKEKRLEDRKAYERAMQEQRTIIERKDQIIQFCHQRGITELIHFTRIQNLRSILERGLLGRETLENAPQYYGTVFNDVKRYDGHRDAVCLSIGFPNYRLFYKLSCASQAEWVILVIKCDVFWKLDCAFCQDNAASSTVTAIPLPQRRQFTALTQMFANYHHIQRQSLGIPDHYPTNPQAEVLVFETIDPSYITKAHFYTAAAMRSWLNQNNASYPQKLICDQQYFKPREDWHVWIPYNNEAPPSSEPLNNPQSF